MATSSIGRVVKLDAETGRKIAKSLENPTKWAKPKKRAGVEVNYSTDPSVFDKIK